MSFVLVCASDSNCRRLYVDNLVLRGYVAVGIASAEEARQLLLHETPHLIITICPRDWEDGVIPALRQIPALAGTPVIMVSPEPPDADWLNLWHVASHIRYPSDFRTLVPTLHPWLSTEARTPFMPVTPRLQLRDA